MIGGDLSFTSGGWAGTPVADILPVELLPEGPPEKLIDLAPFKLQLTPEGRTHPVTALKLDVAQNRARWAELPELDGVNLVARAKPGATVLGVHPTKKDARRQAAAGAHRRRGGQGARARAHQRRLVALGLRRQRRATSADRAYQRFWDAAIRWLIKDPALNFLRIETDQPEYTRGQKVQVTVRALGTDYQPLRPAPSST